MPVTTQREKLKRREDIFLFLRNYFVQELEISEDRLLPQTDLYQDLELDSIDAFNIAGMIELELDFEIGDDELKQILTIQDIVDHIARHLALDAARSAPGSTLS